MGISTVKLSVHYSLSMYALFSYYFTVSKTLLAGARPAQACSMMWTVEVPAASDKST